MSEKHILTFSTKSRYALYTQWPPFFIKKRTLHYFDNQITIYSDEIINWHYDNTRISVAVRCGHNNTCVIYSAPKYHHFYIADDFDKKYDKLDEISIINKKQAETIIGFLNIHVLMPTIYNADE